MLIIFEALNGLHLSGKLFRQLLQEYLKELGFKLSFVESTIYMRTDPTFDCYKYVATYVDGLCMVMKDPQSLLDQLITTPYNFKLTGSGELAFYVGCEFFMIVLVPCV